jgi:hypothetical protein
VDGNGIKPGASTRASTLSFGQLGEFPVSPSSARSERNSIAVADRPRLRIDTQEYNLGEEEEGDGDEALILRVERLERELASLVQQRRDDSYLLSPDMILAGIDGVAESIMTRRRFDKAAIQPSTPLPSPTPSNESVYLTVPSSYKSMKLQSSRSPSRSIASADTSPSSLSTRLVKKIDSTFKLVMDHIRRVGMDDRKAKLVSRPKLSKYISGRSIYGVKVNRNLVGLAFGLPLDSRSKVPVDLDEEDDNDPVTGTNCKIFLPIIVRRCLEYLDNVGVNEEGIYR